MGRKKTPGLVKRQGIWHIDKQIEGRRICASTGTARLAEAEACLARLTEVSRQARIFGIRPERTFEQAAARFVREYAHKRSIASDIGRLKQLMPWIGDVPIDRLRTGTLQPWVERNQQEGKSAGTINHGLKVVRRILNLAASEWLDEHGLTWLAAAPKIKLLPDLHKRLPYPLTWEEQDALFSALPAHLAEMALFTVNTGCRDQEVCGLRWDWEVAVPSLNTSVFIVPSERVKNGEERLVVLNRIAKQVVDACRGRHPVYVFSFRGRRLLKMLNTGWKQARLDVGLPQVRVHDLKHTFGRRLRAAGVSFEDRQDLLGHRSGRITTHYSAAELSSLLDSANRVCERDGERPELVVLRRLNVG